MNERNIFVAALGKANAADRTAYLDEACGGDTELREQIEGLLRTHEQLGGFLETPALAAEGNRQETPASEGPGTILGSLKLVKEIGEGGFGIVFLAEQEHPIRRQVAVKILKPGMESRQIVARFEAERHALALMDHPNIARVIDGGQTPAGRPYFVMDLVRGLPITDYCDRQQLSTRQRLQLFVTVCQAVQHAHQKGIIHRDLKPSNVMVTQQDGTAVIKVIDFGVAKAISHKLTERITFTEVGQIVGTLEYMAPEQAELNNLDIDTRADVYSLGVILYELLTGSPPFTSRQLRSVAFTEMLRMIREEEPPRPSTKLSSSAELRSIAAQRKLEPKALTRLVHGELDWIVMKCLAKERQRRYETANGLAMEIERYLADEPVLAGPPSAGYRVRKFVRRNRGPVLAASLVMLALVGGVLGSTIGFLRAEEAATAERQAKETAQKRLAQIEKGYDILNSIFENLDPGAQGKKSKPLRLLLGEQLDRAAAQLDSEAMGDPLAVAKLQESLGMSQLHLGHEAKALVLLTKARRTTESLLGSDHPRVLICMHNLAIAYEKMGQMDKALPLFEQTVAKSKEILGPDDPFTLMTTMGLAGVYHATGRLDKALPLFELTLAKRQEHPKPDERDILLSMHDLAFAYLDTGQLDKALPLLEQTLAKQKELLVPDFPDILMVMNSLAGAYQATGHLDKALPLFKETLAKQKEQLGPDHPDVLTTTNNLASAYQASGQIDKALPLFEQTLAKQKEQHGANHPDTIKGMNNLASAYYNAHQLDKALALLDETLAKSKEKLGLDHPNTLTTMNNLASVYLESGQIDKALPLFEQTLAKRLKKLGPDHPATLQSMNNLAQAYRDAGQMDKALPLYEQTLAKQKKKLGPDHPDTLTYMSNLAFAYWLQRKLDRSIPLFEEALKGRKAKLGLLHAATLETMCNLGVNYREAGRVAEAIALLETAHRECSQPQDRTWAARELLPAYVTAGKNNEARALATDLVAAARQQYPADSPELVGVLDQAALALVQVRAFAPAEPILRECLALRQKKEPDAWTTFNTQSILGEALLGLKEYADAEPLLLQGYEGMRQREAKIPLGKAHISGAIDQLVQLYEARGMTDKAEEWRKKLAQARAAEPKLRP
ncbi:MAG TPA: tetratricopeptide repeat protein [Gemmataceae bacterium]|nr:tetratricopeptide repeat protein [Gemmataceae bacterium]